MNTEESNRSIRTTINLDEDDQRILREFMDACGGMTERELANMAFKQALTMFDNNNGQYTAYARRSLMKKQAATRAEVEEQVEHINDHVRTVKDVVCGLHSRSDEAGITEPLAIAH